MMRRGKRMCIPPEADLYLQTIDHPRVLVASRLAGDETTQDGRRADAREARKHSRFVASFAKRTAGARPQSFVSSLSPLAAPGQSQSSRGCLNQI
jgi:hypothetical protein